MGRPKGDRKKEHYYQAAKKRGYRSRSAFKLKQVANSYDLLSGVDSVLELCCSPGGWTQVLRELDDSLRIVAVDLEPILPVKDVLFIRGDITSPETQSEIEKATGGSVGLVLSDCSPRVSGNWDLDVARQLFLAEATMNLGMRLLGPKGKVLAKVFQGPGFQEFMDSVRLRYGSVRFIKPDASRPTSAEIYVLASHPRKKQSVVDRD